MSKTKEIKGYIVTVKMETQKVSYYFKYKYQRNGFTKHLDEIGVDYIYTEEKVTIDELGGK